MAVVVVEEVLDSLWVLVAFLASVVGRILLDAMVHHHTLGSLEGTSIDHVVLNPSNHFVFCKTRLLLRIWLDLVQPQAAIPQTSAR